MSYNAVIKSDDSQAIPKLKENIESVQSRIDYMQGVNDYYKANGTMRGYPGMDEQTVEKLDARVSDKQETPYPGKFFSDNFANIRRLERNVERLTNNPESIFQGWQFNGGEAVVNLANNRLQLMFNEKPSDGRRAILKMHGFKWAPTAKAWQRKLDPASFKAADKISFAKPLDGKMPSQLQPKMPQKNLPER